jgi:CheY-like chemotaxis protein
MIEESSSDIRKVLVIDDEQAIVTYLRTVLEDEGYETCSAGDAEEALAVAREQQPDLITLDIMMPKRSGIALYQDLKLDPGLCRIPVVLVSAFSRNNDFRSVSFRKIVSDERVPVPEAYVEKPINVADFLKTVASLIKPVASDASAGGGESP